MLKNLQIYTLVIIIIVVVLSQFTLMSEPGSASTGSTLNQAEQDELSSTEDAIGLIKDTKYGQPIAEVTGTIKDINKSLKKFKGSVQDAKELLDIEKNLNKLSKAMN